MTVTLGEMVIVEALILGAKAEKGFSSKLEESRYAQTAKLWLDLYNFWDGYKVDRFYGHNPLTGLPVTVVFNEPAPNRASLMNWNPLLRSWMYSKDAGLTWERCELTSDVLDKTDCLCDKPEYDGDK